MATNNRNSTTASANSKPTNKKVKLSLSTSSLSSSSATTLPLHSSSSEISSSSSEKLKFCPSTTSQEGKHMQEQEEQEEQLTEKDKRMASALVTKLQKLSDFSKSSENDLSKYARTVILTLRKRAKDNEEFRDLALGLFANVHHLEGEIALSHITAQQLGEMEVTDMLSPELRAKMRAFSKKRAREQTNIDKTSMMCDKCGLVRRDRLNVNEVGLDSEENGTHFEYNFENVCTCEHSSSDDSDSDNDSDDDNRDVYNGGVRLKIDNAVINAEEKQ